MATETRTLTPLLEVRGLVKTFPGVRALDGVDFDLLPGEVHALVGENGAGKSTLMHTLAGVHQPDSGTIILRGQPVAFADPHAASRMGISVVFQELSLSENLSVAENIFANRQPVGPLNLVDWGSLYAQTRNLLDLFEMRVDPREMLCNLSAAQRQVVEILKALSVQPSVLILDEPTSSLTARESEILFGNVRRLKTQGVSCIYITHHLSEIFHLADRVTVLRDGHHVITCPVAGVSEEELVRRMVGRELADMYGSRATPIGEECLRVESAGREGVFSDISFALRGGEILGLAGLAGAGRTEFARGLFGAEPLDTGEIRLDGQPVRIRGPHDAIRHHLAYLTEDRKGQGLFLGMTVRDNCAAPSLSCFATPRGLMDERAMTDFAEYQRVQFNIATPSTRQRVGNLSGGNQQKVLLAMWMGVKPRVLIVDEPTRGVDVGARSDIYHRLRELAATGVGILLISSDLPEILGLSDRVLVMRNGRMAGEFTRGQATEENIIACASGLAAPTSQATGVSS